MLQTAATDSRNSVTLLSPKSSDRAPASRQSCVCSSTRTATTQRNVTVSDRLEATFLKYR